MTMQNPDEQPVGLGVYQKSSENDKFYSKDMGGVAKLRIYKVLWPKSAISLERVTQ